MTLTAETVARILEERGCDQVSIRGNEVWCCCPLHDETRPSFSINVEKGVYNCFACGGGRLSKLLEKWGIADAGGLGYAGTGLRDRLERLKDPPAISRVCDPTDTRYLDEPPFGQISRRAAQYLVVRGFPLESQARLLKHWGLWSSRRRGREYLHFPVFDPRPGRPPLFEATRALDRKEYRYSRGSKKSENLYGQHLIPVFGERLLSRRKSRGLVLVVVEGLFDALKVWSFGVNVVALMGARPSDAQCRMLMRAHEIVWALDNDLAGRVGTAEGVRKLDNTGVKQSVLQLGPHKDPGDVPDRASFLSLMSLSLSRVRGKDYSGGSSLAEKIEAIRRPGGN